MTQITCLFLGLATGITILTTGIYIGKYLEQQSLCKRGKNTQQITLFAGQKELLNESDFGI